MRYRYGRGGYEEQHYPDMLHQKAEKAQDKVTSTEMPEP